MKGVFERVANMTGKDLRWIPLFNKVVDLRPATLL